MGPDYVCVIKLRTKTVTLGILRHTLQYVCMLLYLVYKLDTLYNEHVKTLMDIVICKQINT